MLVKFIKSHLANKEGQVAEVSESTGNYLIRCHVCVSAESDDTKISGKEKVEIPEKKEKVEIELPKKKQR